MNTKKYELMTAKRLKEWLKPLNDDDLVAIALTDKEYMTAEIMPYIVHDDEGNSMLCMHGIVRDESDNVVAFRKESNYD